MNNGVKALISIVIPIKNAESWLMQQRKAFSSQTLIEKTEFIYIDSGSIDKSIEIIETFSKTTFIQISPDEFNHGETRNLGVRNANGSFVVMTVQDAIPSSSKWLEHLLNGFMDESVAGVCGQQVVPHELDKNPIEWFRPVSKPGKRRIQFTDSSLYNGLSPVDKKSLCGWDDVNAMYRKEMLLKIPFKKINFGEDTHWAQDVLMQGYAIVYNTEAQVYHYHHVNYDYAFKRTIAVLYTRYTAFEFIAGKTTFKQRCKIVASNIKVLLLKSTVSWKEKFKWLRYNLIMQKAGRDALKAFHTAIAKGRDEVDKLYFTYCEKAPMAKK